MGTSRPIKDKKALEKFKNFYLKQEDYRNHALIIIGLNTALRISDILNLKWKDVYLFSHRRFKKHICLIEQKTGKESIIALNDAAITALSMILHSYTEKNIFPEESDFIFIGRKHTGEPLSRSQAFRVIKEAAEAAGLDEHISCHSLRKTFGYFAWKQGVFQLC